MEFFYIYKSRIMQNILSKDKLNEMDSKWVAKIKIMIDVKY